MKQKRYLIGIDGGSQSTKVFVFDEQGHVVASGSEKLMPLHSPRPDIAEHPDDDLWNSLVIACRRAMELFNGDPGEIAGIGLCTIRCCRALLNGEGTLASPVLNWMDVRLSRPYQHLDDKVKWVTTSSGYIGCRLTGEFRDTAANYEGQWPIDKTTWDWSEDPEIIATYNIPRDMLFDLVKPGEILGYLTENAAVAMNLPAGIPVVATANDKAVEALGAGLEDGNNLLVSLGTYIGSMMYGSRLVTDAGHFFSNMASIPGYFLYESGGIRRGMWTISWYQSLLGDDCREVSIEALNREAAAVPAGSDGLMTVPEWLAPPDAPFKKGMMLGFDNRHTRGHIYRSIFEAIALTMKNHADAMLGELEWKLEDLVISGGGAKSDLFMQIFADVFEVPARRSGMEDAAAMGSAICAAVATGIHADFVGATAAMVKRGETFQPIPEQSSLYRRMNAEVYRDITSYTDILLQRSHKIFRFEGKCPDTEKMQGE